MQSAYSAPGRRRRRGSRRCRDAPAGAPPEGNAKEVTRRRRRVTTAASRETVSWRTAACQPPGVIQELRWPHGGHGDCASARAGYGVRRWARAPRPAGARVGGAIHCVAAPAEALSLRSLFGRRKEIWRAAFEARGARFHPNLGRQTGTRTHGQTDKSDIGLHRKFLSFRARANFTLAVNL